MTPLSQAKHGIKVLHSLSTDNPILDDWLYENHHISSPLETGCISKFSRNWAERTSVCVGSVVKGLDKPVLNNYLTCYGALNFDNKWTRKTVYLFSTVPKGKLIFYSNGQYKQNLIRCMSWLFNKSPWSNVIKTKRFNLIDGGIIVDARHNVSMVFGALLAFKFIYNNINSVETWCNLVDEGCGPHIAFITVAIKSNYFNSIQYNYSSLFTTKSWSREGVNNFIAGKPTLKNKTYYKLNSYRGYGYGGTNDRTVQDTFITNKMNDKKCTVRGDLVFKGLKEGDSLENKSVRTAFIKETKKMFPKAY